MATHRPRIWKRFPGANNSSCTVSIGFRANGFGFSLSGDGHERILLEVTSDPTLPFLLLSPNSFGLLLNLAYAAYLQAASCADESSCIVFTTRSATTFHSSFLQKAHSHHPHVTVQLLYLVLSANCTPAAEIN